MKKFVLGDVHGGCRALVQVFERAVFDYENDQLVLLGDVCDGWSETPECFEELLKVKNLVWVLGNHDEWVLEWMRGKMDLRSSKAESWLTQGGEATKSAYLNSCELITKHRQFLEENALPYYLNEENVLFVHAGFDPNLSMEKQTGYDLRWNRDLCEGMFKGRNWCKSYKEVYLGHTPTLIFEVPNRKLPIHRRNCWNVDTGAAFTGPLTLMNVDTHEYFQSDDVRTLYPDEKGRNKKSYNVK